MHNDPLTPVPRRQLLIARRTEMVHVLRAGDAERNAPQARETADSGRPSPALSVSDLYL